MEFKAQVAQITPGVKQARFASLYKEVLGQAFRLFPPGILPKTFQPSPCTASIFHIDKRSRACVILPGHSELHAMRSAILWPFRTNRPLSHLAAPIGYCRQVLFFIGSFQHLDNLTLYGYEPGPWQGGLPNDLTLVPPFAPPLRGQLEVSRVEAVGLLKDMVHLFGGIRFRHIVLFSVAEAQLLLSACAGTLETLQLYPTDPRGKRYCVQCVRFPGQRSCS